MVTEGHFSGWGNDYINRECGLTGRCQEVKVGGRLVMTRGAQLVMAARARQRKREMGRTKRVHGQGAVYGNRWSA